MRHGAITLPMYMSIFTTTTTVGPAGDGALLGYGTTGAGVEASTMVGATATVHFGVIDTAHGAGVVSAMPATTHTAVLVGDGAVTPLGALLTVITMDITTTVTEEEIMFITALEGAITPMLFLEVLLG